MKKLMIATLIASGLAGCASNNYAEKSPTEVAQAVTVKNSDFDRVALVIGPKHVTDIKRNPFTDTNYTQLVGSVDKKTKDLKYRVHTTVVYQAPRWRFYDSVSLVNGTQRKVSVGQRTVDSCTTYVGCLYTEEVSFEVDVSELGAIGAQGDFQYRLNSTSGIENAITVKRQYIDGFHLAFGLLAPKF